MGACVMLSLCSFFTCPAQSAKAKLVASPSAARVARTSFIVSSWVQVSPCSTLAETMPGCERDCDNLSSHFDVSGSRMRRVEGRKQMLCVDGGIYLCRRQAGVPEKLLDFT